MTENTTPKNQSGKTNAEAEAEADKNSVSPTQAEEAFLGNTEVRESLERAAKQPTVKRTRDKSVPTEPYAVVSGGKTDEVRHSVAVYKNTKSRKSLTVHHLQRRLTELGYGEAGADLDGLYGDLTALAVTQWQKDNGHEETGAVSREEFAEIFDGDVNVTVLLDTMG